MDSPTKKNYAPIALFIYNRHDKAIKTINSLERCIEFGKSKIFVFSDGPKNDFEKSSVFKTRQVVKKLLINKDVTYVYQKENIGLANSIYLGVSSVLEKYDSIIVLEDDLIVNHGFLNFMNDALDYFKNCDKVYQISGYFFNPKTEKLIKDIVLLDFISTWGWATWKKSWEGFDLDTTKINMNLSKNEINKFNLNGAYNYFKMLNRRVKNKVDSWGILWYYFVYLKDGLVVYPPKSFVYNNGFDKNATNTIVRHKLIEEIDFNEIIIYNFPNSIEVNQDVKKLVYNQIKEKYNMSFIKKFLNFLIKK